MKQPQVKKHNIFQCALSYSLVVVGFVLLFASCKTPRNLTYMQGAFDAQQSATTHSIRLMADDKVSIFVKSRDEVLTQHFNISLPNMQQVLTYTLDDQGNIDFPMLGKVALLGLTRVEAAQRIKNRLVQEFGAKDVVVTVDFSKLTFSVLGEVNKAGNFDITKDRITIFDALGMAGDMTIYGQRDSVKVFREVDGKPVAYTLNLASAPQVLQSPAYYLQQNDVVYVPANRTRQRQATINGNTLQSTSFWVSVASLFATVAVLIFK